MSKLKEHPTHAVLGLGMIAIGLWLIANDHFFMWPPAAVGVANDDVWGALFVIDGLGLLIWVAEGGKSVAWNRRLLTVTSGLMAFLTVLQFLTWVATGLYMSWISNVIITAFVLILARRSDTRND
jgi:hypothetical protein